MKRYLVKRLFLLLFLLFAVSTLVFFLVHLLPGDPAQGQAGPNATDSDIQQVRHQMNLDKPLLNQYLDFLGQQASFSFGRSLIRHIPVKDAIVEVLPDSLTLAVWAMSLAVMFSFPLGVWAAYREHSVIDAAITFATSMGFAIPAFLLGPVLIILFAVKLDWLPVSGTAGTGGWTALVLPALTLATSLGALLTRIIKTSVATELPKPYVQLARAKGLREFRVLTRHVMKNAMIPIVTTIGLQLGALVSGTVIVETVFSRQGIGSLLVNAIHQRDYPMVQGVVVFIAFVYLSVNFVVDVSYFFMDPRIRHELKNS